MIAHDIVSPTHLLLILVVLLLVLGPKRLPQAGRAIGRSIREFRSATSLEPPPANASADSANASADSAQPAERR